MVEAGRSALAEKSAIARCAARRCGLVAIASALLCSLGGLDGMQASGEEVGEETGEIEHERVQVVVQRIGVLVEPSYDS